MAERARTRVVLLVCDALPDRWVSPETTPHLHALAAEGGRAPGGAEGVLSAATYPNHATFATGTTPRHHRVVANQVWDGSAFQAASHVGPAVPTLLHAASDAGLVSVAVAGDQHLPGVMGFDAATAAWPPPETVPAGTATDAFGYPADHEVVGRLAQLLDRCDADVVLVHLNGPDTAAHCFGPDSDEAIDQYRATDAAAGQVLALLRPRWTETVVIAVSDHDQEPTSGEPPLDVAAEARRRGLAWAVTHDGSSAVAHRAGAAGPLPVLAGEDGRHAVDDDTVVLWPAPGRWCSSFDFPLRGVHGSPRTRRQVGVVGGGHPSVSRLGARVSEGGVRAEDWAPTMAVLAGVALPQATGRALC